MKELGVELLMMMLSCCFRPLLRRANRKVMRKRMSGGRGRNSVHANVSYHPHLSMVQGKGVMLCLV